MASNILPYKGTWPTIDSSVFLAPTANVIGDVEIGAETNIWWGCLVRGDMNVIRIGRRVNIQDLTVVHVDSQKYGTFIGDQVTPGKTVKAGQLWAGSPAKFIRDCAEQENEMIERVPPEYWGMAQAYLKDGIGVVEGTQN